MKTMHPLVRHMAISILTITSLIAYSFAPTEAPIHANTDTGFTGGRAMKSDDLAPRANGNGARLSESDVADHARVVEEYGKLPLSFEPNLGQTDPHVKFLSRADGYTLFLTSTEAVLALRGDKARAPMNRAVEPDPGASRTPTVQSDLLRIKLVGANPRAVVEGQDSLPGKTNYLIGNDRSRWQTDIPTWRQVRYASVWPGIDVIWYGNQRTLEYDFVLQPGADPAQIKMRFAGAAPLRPLRIDGEGNLILKTSAGEITQHAPLIYQDRGHARERKNIAGKYVLKGPSEVGFAVGAYDKAEPLVIDPQLVYSTYLGGGGLGVGLDVGLGIAADSSGNAYIAGRTESLDFPVTNVVDPNAFPGEGAAFVTKLNQAGTDIVYSTIIGSSSLIPHRDLDPSLKGTQANAIAVTGDGRACITGFTDNDDNEGSYPVTSNAYQNKGVGCVGVCDPLRPLRIFDAFVTELNAAGNDLIYSTFFGGSAILANNGKAVDVGTAITLDSSDHIYIAGSTASNNLPIRNGFQGSRQSSGAGTDAFIAVFNPAQSNGNDTLLYSSFLGGSGDDVATCVAVDSAGVAYVGGQTESTDLSVKSPAGQSLPPFRSTFQGGGGDGFVAKIDPDSSSSSSLIYLTYFGGSGTDTINAIAVDNLQRAYITGTTDSTSSSFPLRNAFDSLQQGGEAFVAKLNANGTAVFYSSFLGGNGVDQGFGIAIDSAGNTYVAGRTGSGGTFPTVNPLAPGFAGTAFLTKIEASVSSSTVPRILYSVTFGGISSGIEARAIAIDRQGHIYLTGQTGNGLPTTPGVSQAAFAGGPADAFVAKFGSTFPDTIGVFRPSTNQFLLRNSNTAGNPDITIGFGQAGDIPIAGDWNGDGVEDVGVFRPSAGQFLLRQTTPLLVCVPFPCHVVTVVSIITLNFGQAGDLPIAGDWDGDGIDTVGVFRNGTFLLRDSNSPANGSFTTVTFGAAGDLPIAGDWDGDGVDTVGFFRPSAIQFQLTNTTQGVGVPNFTFFFGLATDLPVAGDFNGDGIDTVGVFRDGVFFLTNSNSNPSVETTAPFGAAGDNPIVGDWDGKPSAN